MSRSVQSHPHMWSESLHSNCLATGLFLGLSCQIFPSLINVETDVPFTFANKCPELHNGTQQHPAVSISPHWVGIISQLICQISLGAPPSSPPATIKYKIVEVFLLTPGTWYSRAGCTLLSPLSMSPSQSCRAPNQLSVTGVGGAWSGRHPSCGEERRVNMITIWSLRPWRRTSSRPSWRLSHSLRSV